MVIFVQWSSSYTSSYTKVTFATKEKTPVLILMLFLGSGGGIRTHDQSVTHYPKVSQRGGLYLYHIISDVGTPVSSLYGAPAHKAGSHGIRLLRPNVGV